MTAGLPGTGIGGVFYLLSALFMPLVELFLTLRGKSSIARWLLVIRQLVMAAGILGGMWVMGATAGLIFDLFIAEVPDPGLARDLHNHIAQTAFRVNIFHIAPVLMSIATLSVILAATHILRFFIRPLSRKSVTPTQ